MPVGLVKGNSLYYVHTDHLGTPRVITNNANTTVWKWNNTDPFGGNLPTTQTIVYNKRFAGQYFDNESKLHYNYYRTYNPLLGRYIQSDPLGLAAGFNTYSYVGSNPLGAIDPLGLVGLDSLGGAFVGGVFNGFVNGLNYYNQNCSFTKGFLNGFIGGAIGGAIFTINPVLSGSVSGAITQSLNRRQQIQSFSNVYEDLGWAAFTGGFAGFASGAGATKIALKYNSKKLGNTLGNINSSTYGIQFNNWINTSVAINSTTNIDTCGCN